MQRKDLNQRVAILLMILLIPLSLAATHQRAAEFRFRWVSGYKYEIMLISYTFTPSLANQYRDYLLVLWGDGTSSNIPRVQEDTLGNNITFNRYVGTHDYAGPSTYILSCEDPNRNGDILNIPNSVNIPLYIYSELTISPFLNGFDNSPILLIPPVDNACVHQPFLHNPGAYDPDGDSLSYKLVPCRGAMGLPIPGYTYPPIQAGDSLNLDPVTGDFYWDSPPQAGEFNIAILVEEWRNGVKIGSVLRDMQIIVVACDNLPPIVQQIADTCVEAGDTLVFQISATDSEDTQVITLTGTGQPMLMTDHPATLDPFPATGSGSVQTTFTWGTVCNHIRRFPYTMFFKAQDNGTPVNLVDIQSMRIRVVGPAPENLIAQAIGTSIRLTWDPYACPNAQGFDIYRRADSSGWVHGYCETGVPADLGYTKIARLDTLGVTTYLDDNKGSGLVQGIRFCYLLVAWFPDRAESYASNEACAYLKKDMAVITNASIKTTDVVTGSVYVAWSKPTELDSVQAPGPYRYILQRSSSGVAGSFIAIDSTENLNDTIFTDTLLNTRDYTWWYRVDLRNLTPGNTFLIGKSQVAATPFIRLSPTDNAMRIDWNNDVPWFNNRFVIYRSGDLSASYDSVGESDTVSYLDKRLNNGQTYCYYVKCIGRYSASGFVDPIINLSQRTCGVPVDNVPPCPPQLHVGADCITSDNILGWNPPVDSCSADIARYVLYFSPCNRGPMSAVDSVYSPLDTTWTHHPENGIPGCYSIVAVDSTGNRSIPSDTTCITLADCPDNLYHLPNVFTPNGDEVNETFHPFTPYVGIRTVHTEIFDRWGKMVYSTSDPDIDWDGHDATTGGICSTGTYYVVCEVEETTLCGTQKRSIHGSVTILR